MKFRKKMCNLYENTGASATLVYCVWLIVSVKAVISNTEKHYTLLITISMWRQKNLKQGIEFLCHILL